MSVWLMYRQGYRGGMLKCQAALSTCCELVDVDTTAARANRCSEFSENPRAANGAVVYPWGSVGGEEWCEGGGLLVHSCGLPVFFRA